MQEPVTPPADGETSAAGAEKKKRTRQRADVLFLGDLCFGASYGHKPSKRRGLGAGFAKLDPLLQRVDYVVANLETTLTTHSTSPIQGRKSYIHKDDPAMVEVLQRYSIDAVSLGNNHAFDYGPDGLVETLQSLRACDIQAFGAGLNQAEASRALVFEPAPRRTPFKLAIAAGKQRTRYRYEYYAGEDQAGINGWTPESVADQIRGLREAEPEAFLVVFAHWGSNYEWRDEDQTELARAMVGAGADLIIGHGAHCLQEIDCIEDRWVLFSIGNSVFNTPGGFRNRPHILPYSLIAKLRLREGSDGLETSLRLYPILSDNRRTRYRPRFVKRAELHEIREHLLERSATPQQLGDALGVGKDVYGRFLSLPIMS